MYENNKTQNFYFKQLSHHETRKYTQKERNRARRAQNGAKWGVISSTPLRNRKKKQKSRPNPQTSNQNLKKNKKIKYKIITTNQNIHFQIITFLDRQPSYGARWGGMGYRSTQPAKRAQTDQKCRSVAFYILYILRT